MVRGFVLMVVLSGLISPHVAMAVEPVAIISLPVVYKQVGLKGMKNLPVYVDQDCGKYFRTVATDGKFYVSWLTS